MLNCKSICLLFFALSIVVNEVSCKLVVCYYTNWAQYRQPGGKFYPEDIDPALCTHIIYSFAKLDGNSELAAYEWNDESTSWSTGMYERVLALKSSNPSLKVTIAVGGWNHGSGKFSDMVTDASLRSKFVRTSVEFLQRNGFDGLDLDWEYPGSRAGSRASDKQLFTTLCQELKAAFAPYGYILSAAVSAGVSTIESGYEIPQISQHLDFINLMAYDLHGSWESFTGFNAPLYANDQLNVDFAVDYWLSHGCPPEKLILGLGTYGRSFSLSNSAANQPGDSAKGAGSRGRLTGEGGFLAYYEICENLNQGWTSVFDNNAQTPYAYKSDQWVGYDNELSLRIKAQYAMSKNLGGIMFWALDLDDFSGSFCGQGNYPLIRSAIAGMGSSQPVVNPVTNVPITNAPVTNAPVTNPPITNAPVTNPPATNALNTNSPQITTRAPTGSGVCQGRDYYADRASGCTYFYQCMFMGTQWERAHRMACPAGLLFDNNIKTCNWPASVVC